MQRSPTHALIIPVYGNAGSIPELLDDIDWIAARIGGPLETIFVVDGSPDASYAVLHAALAGRPSLARLVCLSRNFGSFAAIRTGLARAGGKYFAVMAADLQDPPELVVAFYHALEQDRADVVVGTRAGRDDPLMSRLFSAAYWLLYRRFVLTEIPAGGADHFACNERVRAALCALPEVRTSLVGLLFWVGFRRAFIPYRRRPRRHGRSGWSFRRRFQYMLDSIFAFSDLPIALLTLIGVLGVLASAVIAALVFGAWAGGWITVPGYTPIVLSISFFGALNLFGIGVVGAYVWRTYENSKGRSYSIVASEEFFGPAP